MKTLMLLTLTLAACGSPFSAAPVGAGSGGAGTGPYAGASSALPDTQNAAGAMESGGGGEAGALPGPTVGGESPGGGAAGAGGAVASAGAGGAVAYVPPPCSPVTQGDSTGYLALGIMPVCLRVTTPINTIGCALGWDNRSIRVNGATATCEVTQDFPSRGDGAYFIELGSAPTGSIGTAAAIRWFLTAPSPQACAARVWELGDRYYPGEINVSTCDEPEGSGCVLGEPVAFSCSGSACSSVQPGGSGSNWTATWKLEARCP